MANLLKITKNHHKQLNDPFPSPPKSPPFVQGTLFLDPLTLPSSTSVFSIGKDFQLSWSSSNGGCFSISHRSQPTKAMWSTVPGQAFVSPAMAETEVEESRGSFVVKDRTVHFVCDHQTVKEIRAINRFDSFSDFPSGMDPNDIKDFPAVLISGRVFSKKKRVKVMDDSVQTKAASVSARYWVFFNQRSSKDIEFQVKFGRPTFHSIRRRSSPSPTAVRGMRMRLGCLRKKKVGWYWSFPKGRGVKAVSSSSVEEEEEAELKLPELVELNRVCFTYSSEASERFYGFGEQFSHMISRAGGFPIFVQEQGIGRGDQPITFAANLVRGNSI